VIKNFGFRTLAPPRWAPPVPWQPDDEEAFMRGWNLFEIEAGIQPRRIGF